MTEKFKILVTRKWPKKVEESLVETFDTTLNVEDKAFNFVLDKIKLKNEMKNTILTIFFNDLIYAF